MILDSKKIEYKKIDVAADEDAKKRMRELSGNPKAIPPQLFNDGQYCGVGTTSQSVVIIPWHTCVAIGTQ